MQTINQNHTASYGAASRFSAGTGTATVTAEFRGFSGVDRRLTPAVRPSSASPSPLSELDNFRVLPGGTLEKRDGIRCLAVFPEPVRGVYQATLNGVRHLFAMSGYGIYEIDPETGESQQICRIYDDAASVIFFSDDESCYLLMGEDLYRYTGGRFVSHIPYVPLYGKDWPNSLPPSSCKVHQPLNRLTDHIRVRYLIREGENSDSFVFQLPFAGEALDYVAHNGATVTVDGFTNSRADSVTVQKHMSINDTVEIGYRVKASVRGNLRLNMVRCIAAFSPEEETGVDSVLMLAGNSSYLFYSQSVSSSDYYDQRTHYSQAGDLYFPMNCQKLLPACHGAILGMAPKGNKMLLFSKQSTFTSELVTADTASGVRFLTKEINRGVGCVVPGCAIAAGNDVVTVSEHGIIRVTDSAEKDADYLFQNLSEALTFPDYIPPANARMFYNRQTGELMISDPENERMWVFRTSVNAWYTYSGFRAEQFFEAGESLGFAEGNMLFVFDPARYDDEAEDGSRTPIRAVMQTPWICPLTDGRILRQAEFSVMGECGGLLSYVLETDGAGGDARRILGILPCRDPEDEEIYPELAGCGTDPGRFRFLRLTLISEELSRTRFFALWLRTAT